MTGGVGWFHCAGYFNNNKLFQIKLTARDCESPLVRILTAPAQASVAPDALIFMKGLRRLLFDIIMVYFTCSFSTHSAQMSRTLTFLSTLIEQDQIWITDAAISVLCSTVFCITVIYTDVLVAQCLEKPFMKYLRISFVMYYAVVHLFYSKIEMLEIPRWGKLYFLCLEYFIVLIIHIAAYDKPWWVKLFYKCC